MSLIMCVKLSISLSVIGVCICFDVFSTTMNNFDQDDLMLADLSTDYNPDDIIDHINVNELIYSGCNNL